MQLKRNIFALVVITVISVSCVSGHEIPYDLEGEINIHYQVLDSNNSTGFWSNYPNPGGQYYNVEKESIVDVTFTSFEDRSTGLDIEIGNLTLNDINETLVQDNLAFGYWSLANTFGFRSTANWNQIDQDLQSTDGLTSTVEYYVSEFLGSEIDLVNITLEDAYQVSNIIYEESTGLLVYGFSNVFGFLLELQIQEINGNSNYFADFSEHGSTTDPASFYLPIVSFLAILALRYRKV